MATPGNDNVVGTPQNDTLVGEAGNDTITPGLGQDQVNGGDDIDLLVVNYSGISYAGGVHVPGIRFTSYDPTLGNGSFYAYTSDTDFHSVSFGSIERFNITGTSQGDYLIVPLGGNSTLAGGAGMDTLAADLSSFGSNQNVTSAGALAGGTTHSGMEYFNVTTGAGNDKITLTGAFNDTLNTGAGNDTVNAGLGKDQVDGGTGTDLLVVDYSGNSYAGGIHDEGIRFSSYDATLGNGSFYAYKSDTDFDSVSFGRVERFNITGTSQGDYLIVPKGGNSTLVGGAGMDTLVANLASIASNQIVTSAGTLADGTIHSAMEYFNVTTGVGNDSFTLTRAFNDSLAGGAGNDTIRPGLGKDQVDGGTDTDLLVVDYSDNTYAGGVHVPGILFSSYDHTLGNGSFYAYKSDTDFDSVGFSGIERFDITGTSQEDYLFVPAGGNSTLSGGAGTDTLVANLSSIATRQVVKSSGTLADGTIHRQMERFNVTTGAGNDTFTLTRAFNDTLAAGGGNDTINGGRGVDAVDGGVGTDLLVADYSANTYAGSGQTTGIRFSSYDSTLGNGSFYAYTNDAGTVDQVSFGSIERFNITGTPQGDYMFNPTGGNSTLIGGAGFDTLIANLSAIATNQVVRSSGTLADGTVHSGFEFFNLSTGAGNDSVILTTTGNDTLNTGAGNDTINGGRGKDAVDGGTGNDILVVDYSTNNYGGGVHIPGLSFNSHDTVLGNGSLYAYFSNTDFDQISFNGIERLDITGTTAGDNIIGGNSKDTLDGGKGNDTISGGDGNDSLLGDVGNDSLAGGTGKDTLAGGAGNDIYVMSGDSDVITEKLSEGNDLVESSATFTLGANFERLTLTGSAAINGTGNSLSNNIIGNSGDNQLSGTNAMPGVGEKDTLTGAAGADVFVLGTAAGRFYDDGDILSSGTGDYALVTDLSREQGDVLQLKGTAANYLIGASPIAGLAGKGLFFDSNNSGTLTANDELIAVIQGTNINLGLDVIYVL